MDSKNIKLIEPCESMEAEFKKFCDEFDCDPDSIHGVGSMDSAKPFATQVADCIDNTRGKNLRPGWIPAATLWMVDDSGVIIGTMSIRHELTEKLAYEGGHIGYSIRPSYRGRGFGNRILALGLDYTRKLGLERVLVCCNKDNSASAGAIKHNGGVLADEVEGKYFINGTVQRYWIEL